ncbi:cupin [Synergistales bacterium]|nr:cupin [Synergistales bacterium]
MKKSAKDQRWVFWNDLDLEVMGEGVKRKILAYSKDLMCVENRFEAGALGKLHSHPHTQITYVVDGVFEFTIEGETKTVKKGDTMLKTDSVEHGCKCVEAGALLDIFTPLREDFVQ